MIHACKVLTKGPGTQRILDTWQLSPSPHFPPMVSAPLFFSLHFGQNQSPHIQKKELSWTR